MRRAPQYIDQFCAGFSSGDAISNEALIIRSFLRRAGFESEIYCEQFADKDSNQVHHYRNYHNKKESLIIYHHSFHTGLLKELKTAPANKLLIFHNVTPAKYVEPYNPMMADSLRLAREELVEIADRFDAVLADSRFNADFLTRLGFKEIGIMPVPVDFSSLHFQKTPPHLRYLEDGRANILFVGRIFPNKMHQDLIKAFYFFHRLDPFSRLLLVGPLHPGVRGYAAELHNLSSELGLEDAIVFSDMVSNDDIAAFYHNSHLFLSMSDHEGFFVPLLESMHFELPILAYGSSVIPETLGESGIVFYEKNFPQLAELMLDLTAEGELRRAVVAGQRERLTSFSPEITRRKLFQVLADLGVPHERLAATTE